MGYAGGVNAPGLWFQRQGTKQDLNHKDSRCSYNKIQRFGVPEPVGSSISARAQVLSVLPGLQFRVTNYPVAQDIPSFSAEHPASQEIQPRLVVTLVLEMVLLMGTKELLQLQASHWHGTGR